MSASDDNRDDQRLARLLASTARDAPPPDEDFLARLRRQSADVFATQPENPPSPDRLAVSGTETPDRLAVPGTGTRATRKHRMFILATRALVASVAATVLGLVLWNVGAPPSAPTLLAALEKTAAADSLQAQVTQDGKTGQIWVREGKLRWNQPDGLYRIARGGRQWLIDEKAGRASPSPAGYFQPGEADKKKPRLDLLALLDLAARPSPETLAKPPAERITRDGHEYDFYLITIPCEGRTLRLEALVDPGTGFLHSLEAKAERDGRVEPLSRLDVVSLNQPVNEDLFVVGDTLTEDGRIGKVVDVQGIVSVKPVMHQRWTPVAGPGLLMPGDWVRTDLRGANAVTARLVPQTTLVLGPGSLAELVKAGQVRIAEGEIKIVASAKVPVELLGPGSERTTVDRAGLYRVQGEKLVRLDQEPLWLRQYEGKTANESIGSLVAKVDGRNVPLSVGFHKVTVDIRDQIARTVVEESFVNHTSAVLEGVFYFPLPQDASISGFGMWINNELVEADVVEKQRAREIYETILRERRDPGLLEWTGGNLFKARVFPIPAYSEKRITITYTQVLPLRGNGYRYQYALQSDLLKQHPLRELAIDVKINSVAPLKSVTSPTHTTRTDQTAHSAHVEFTAQDYTPARDFEVAVELDRRQSDVVLIPHRRGDDGYFMVQLAPPGTDGQWQREVLPDGPPLELLLVADTSASMDAAARKTQAETIGSLLAGLSPKDTFNLAACDVDSHWLFEKPMPADEKNARMARDWLAGRASLGWTDLDKAFASVLQRTGPTTQVVYLGDGVVTAGDGDPVAFGNRLRRLYQEHARRTGSQPVAATEPSGRQVGNLSYEKGGTLHAVAVSSSFEPVVLKTIASLGGGSWRQVTGERGPQAVARDLLAEMVQPGLRGLKVEFRGIRTARVYPEELPNLPAGSQQVLLGRYLPDGRDQEGEVIVSGTQGGKPVRFTGRVSLKDAEQGNSFIPRLWARMHLDHLLQQGRSQAIQDEIIALSEEYHIITPYTSLLVLESDADRERFKVKRRFRIRDGEKFFAEGRDNANYDLVEQQMRRAGMWRIGLRRSVLGQLSAMGRDPRLFEAAPRFRYRELAMPGIGGGSWGVSNLEDGASDSLFQQLDRSDANGLGPNYFWSGPMSSSGAYPAPASPLAEPAGAVGGPAPYDEYDLSAGSERFKESRERGAEADHAVDAEEWSREGGDFDSRIDLVAESGRPGPELEPALRRLSDPEPLSLDAKGAFGFGGGLIVGNREDSAPSDYGFFSRKPQGGRFWASERMSPAGQWIAPLFPSLPPAPAKEKERPAKWPVEARDLARSLLRTGQLVALKDGLQIASQEEQFDPRWGELAGRSHTMALTSPAAWLVRSRADGSQTTVSWTDKTERGTLSRAFLLGRLRASTPEDQAKPPLSLPFGMTTPLDESYRDWRVSIKPQGNQRVLLVLGSPHDAEHETQVLIDTARHVALWTETRQSGKLTGTVRYEDFVEAAGAWWPTRVESLDGEGRRTSLTTYRFTVLAAGAWDNLWKQELALRPQVQFLREPLPTQSKAREAITAGKATFEDHVAMVLHYERSQQWDRVLEHLDKAERLAAGKPGIRWVRSAVLDLARRREEVKKRYFEEATALANREPQPGEGPEVRVAPDQELALANYLLGRAGSILEANEMLRFLDAIRPVFERQPPHLAAMKGWLQQRANLVEQTGHGDQALQLRRQLAEGYPHDSDLQQQYVRALANAGEYEAAYAWLNRALSGDRRWYGHEEESLRGVYADLLRSQGRYPELVDYLAAWTKKNPESATAWRQCLSALVWADRPEEANGLIERWLKEGRQPGQLAPDVRERLEAAVQQAMGQGYNLYSDRIDPRWLDPLADTAIFFARHPTESRIADEIMSNWRFNQSDQARRVRKTAYGWLKGLDKLRVDEIARLVGWILGNDPAIEPEGWRQLASGVRTRWESEQAPDRKNQLGQTLVQIDTNRLTPEDLIAFLRIQLTKGPEPYRPQYLRQLFDALLVQPWREEHEAEALALLGRLGENEEPERRLFEQVGGLYRLTDRMVQARLDAKMKAIDHPEKLTRTELAAKRSENLRAAREGVAGRLREEARKHRPPLATWLTVERLYLDVLLGRNLDQVAGECWEILGPGPREVPPEEPSPWLDHVLRSRCLVTLLNLAARKNAQPDLINRVSAWLDRAIAAYPEQTAWKLFKVQLLIALDRPKDLEKDLRAWTAAGDADFRWRQALAYLLAEQGKLPEAIRLFETAAQAGALGPADWRALADWYMAAGRRDDHHRAMIEVYKFVEEWRLRNALERKLGPWHRSNGPLPSELDQEVFLMFAALFEKSSQPQQHLDLLRRFYQATRDFRLLAGLADAVLGQTAGKVYPFLGGMEPVFSEIHDEATVDSIVGRIGEVRPRAKTDVDQRALDLLEVQAERRAAELKNQPGPHGDRALAALQRAFKRSWAPGEPRLFADLLAALGRIAYAPLAEEQIRELEALHRTSREGAVADRLHIGWRLAQGYWNYGRHEQAIDLLAVELREHQTAVGGALPVEVNPEIDTFVSFLEQRRHYVRAEKFLEEQLKHPANRQQVYWLVQRLYQMEEDAVRNDGELSLGRGVELYRAVEKKLRAELDTPDDNHRNALAQRLVSLYRTAAEKKLPGVVDDLRALAFQRLNEVLRRPTNHYQEIVQSIASALHDLGGARDGLAFLVGRLEAEPAWFRLNNQDGWSRFSWQLGQWRKEAGNLGPLEPRLLKIVTGELRRDLESRVSHNNAMYHKHNTHYWSEKEDAFARVADEVWARQKDSSAAAVYIAQYVYQGLEHYARAIEILLDAHRREVLDETGQGRLVDYLQSQDRPAESVPILEPLVQRRPDNLQYRIWLMHAWFRTGQQAKLLALLKETDAYFHQGGRWQEGAIAQLARGCLQDELYAQSAAYFTEVIALHQRTRPRRGIGDQELSMYYADQARAYAGLKKTVEAVDAACAGIVSWGPIRHDRSYVLQVLRDVLQQSPDLDAYVAHLDKETQETGLDKPVVRKALGEVYFQRQEFAKAARQLAQAAELQPNDPEIQQKLVECCDRQGDKEGAIRQLLRSLETSRRDLPRYEDLGRRFEAVGKPEDAERAYTSAVEALPSESESHALLAEIRQRQNRWGEAITQWEQVARIRALEPTGLLKLAEAQLHERRLDDAAATLTRLRSRSWPSRFGTVDHETRRLEEQLERHRSK